MASATAVDGHNWLYHVCIGVFDSETNENWVWVMSKLREVVGLPRGLAISMDVGQAMMNGVAEVFPQAEHREYKFHLGRSFMTTFGKRLTRGTHTCLRSIGLKWRKLSLLQLII